MGILNKIGISAHKNSKAAKLFEELFPEKSFMDIEYEKPSDYVIIYWEAFKSHNMSSLNGQMFEIILATLFVRENLVPMYLQANVAFVPNVNYDILFYTKESGPISLSLKTSLRERYKQADLEAIALKYVHRKAKCYLLSMEQGESQSTKAKIKSGDVIGLDEVILCTSEDLDILVSKLKELDLSLAGSVNIITTRRCITKEQILSSQYGTKRK